jgi:hypothetical protein
MASGFFNIPKIIWIAFFNIRRWINIGLIRIGIFKEYHQTTPVKYFKELKQLSPSQLIDRIVVVSSRLNQNELQPIKQEDFKIMKKKSKRLLIKTLIILTHQLQTEKKII